MDPEVDNGREVKLKDFFKPDLESGVRTERHKNTALPAEKKNSLILIIVPDRHTSRRNSSMNWRILP